MNSPGSHRRAVYRRRTIARQVKALSFWFPSKTPRGGKRVYKLLYVEIWNVKWTRLTAWTCYSAGFGYRMFFFVKKTLPQSGRSFPFSITLLSNLFFRHRPTWNVSNKKMKRKININHARAVGKRDTKVRKLLASIHEQKSTGRRSNVEDTKSSTVVSRRETLKKPAD